MIKALAFFTLSAILTVLTFYSKSEHSLDLYLAIPVGLYFIAALLLIWRPKVPWSSLLQFAGSALLVWVILYGLSYNLLFMFIAPVSGGLGAWLIILLAKKFLGVEMMQKRLIIITGVLTAILGVLFMIAVRDLSKETFTIGLKAGAVAAFWQLGVGLQLARRAMMSEAMESDAQ